jgi:pyridoxamine 5'-phosphate oxidase family protein
MGVFTEAEQSYLENQPLGRLATTGPDGSPQTRPVSFTYNRELDCIDIGGRNLTTSRKYRNVVADPRVSFLVDDLASTDPWTPRAIEIRGTAQTLVARPVRDGFTGDLIRIWPARIIAMGLDTEPFAAPHTRNVVTGPAPETGADG